VLGRSTRLRIGIAWQGNPYHKWDRHRSFPLIQAAPLGRLENVQLFSLQRLHGLDQLQTCAQIMPVESFGPDLDTEAGAFMDTVAIMKHLDLVIAADTAIAHVAGAVGVPVWVPLSAIADWRWLVGREDSPWYPTMRLFRQPAPGQWGPVFAQIAAEVQALAERRRAEASTLRPAKSEDPASE
jgi:hypothetical protein